MTPEQIGALVERYGLPLIILGGFLWLMLKGKLVTGGQLKQSQDETLKMSALYERERTDRIAAESVVAKSASAGLEVATAVREALTVVVKKDPYAERLEGTPRRGR